MPLLNVQLSFDNMNFSAQVDDIVYYSVLGTSIGGFNQTATSNTYLLGRIISISGSSIVVEYDDAIYNGKMAVEVAKHMHSVDTDNYYSASVQVTFSPVLIDGGSKEPQEIGLWSSDSVATDDEFDFEGA